MDTIPRSTKSPLAKARLKKTVPVEDNVKVKCSACGKEYTRQKENFRPSPSVIYAGNNGYTTVCRHCIDDMFLQYVDKFGDVQVAFKRICLHFDFYYNDNLFKLSRANNKGKEALISTYFSRTNLPQYGGAEKTYDDTLDEEVRLAITTNEPQNKDDSSDDLIGAWGFDFQDQNDRKLLIEHYNMLKTQNPNCDNNQEIFIKDLCLIKLQQMYAFKDKKIDDFKKLTDLYRDTFKQAGLKTIQETDASNDETFGVTLAVISQYTPEEYYKDKTLYKDFDGILDYIIRHVFRPLKNLKTGSVDKDVEFSVRDDGSG